MKKTFLTNIQSKNKLALKATIAAYKIIEPKRELLISNNALDTNGNPLKTHIALYDCGTGDLTLFWNIYNFIESSI